MSTPPDTRPASSDPADIAAYQERQERIRRQEEFQAKMYDFAGDTRVRLVHMAEVLERHSREDNDRFAEIEARFAPVTQSITETGNKLAWILGGAAGIMGVLGLALTIWGALK